MWWLGRSVDPLSPANKLLFSAGPFAGTTFSNANRTSVGCKSPLTGGIKEANGGGTFGYAMGQLAISHFTLHEASADWVVIHFKKDGAIDFDDATLEWDAGSFGSLSSISKGWTGRLDLDGSAVSGAIMAPFGEPQGLAADAALDVGGAFDAGPDPADASPRERDDEWLSQSPPPIAPPLDCAPAPP